MWMGTLLGKELIRNCSRYEQWRDFRKRHKAYEDIAINCPTKFPRASTLLKNYEGSHISMKKKTSLHKCLLLYLVPVNKVNNNK